MGIMLVPGQRGLPGKMGAPWKNGGSWHLGSNSYGSEELKKCCWDQRYVFNPIIKFPPIQFDVDFFPCFFLQTIPLFSCLNRLFLYFPILLYFSPRSPFFPFFSLFYIFISLSSSAKCFPLPGSVNWVEDIPLVETKPKKLWNLHKKFYLSICIQHTSFLCKRYSIRNYTSLIT